MQNSITSGTDHTSIVYALVQGESLTTFKTVLQGTHTAEDGIVANLMDEHVDTAMEVIAQTVFSHRALETQKL